MTSTVEAVSAVRSERVDDCRADTLRALAEAGVRGPAAPSLVARLNPAYPSEATRLALDELQRAGLVERRPHPASSLLTSYALTGAGRRWVRERG